MESALQESHESQRFSTPPSSWYALTNQSNIQTLLANVSAQTWFKNHTVLQSGILSWFGWCAWTSEFISMQVIMWWIGLWRSDPVRKRCYCKARLTTFFWPCRQCNSITSFSAHWLFLTIQFTKSLAGWAASSWKKRLLRRSCSRALLLIARISALGEFFR